MLLRCLHKDLINTPNGDCVHFFAKDYSKVEILITSIASKFTLLNNFAEVHLDPTRTFCPRSECDGVCQINTAKRHGRRLHSATGPRPVVCSSVSVVIVWDRISLRIRDSALKAASEQVLRA